MRYRLDPTWWRHSHADGETVVAGSPTRILRLTSTAAAFLDDLEQGRPPSETTKALQTRLVDAGAIHPVAHDVHEPTLTLGNVTAVIPARIDHVDQLDGLRTLIESLPPEVDVLVIDDGSPAAITVFPRAHIVRNKSPRGPAAARNQAIEMVASDFVLFLDSDIVLPVRAADDAFWQPLLFHMVDPAVALVAPRVLSEPGTSTLARYETLESPLDMGSMPAIVRSGARVAYVPSAAVLGRTQILRQLGGFDETLRYGEDVDLVWRAAEADFVCRYEPEVTVSHEPRRSWSALAEQRFRYGTSAAPLEARHPGSTRPLRINRWSAATIAMLLVGHPVVAAAIAASTVISLARRLSSLPDRWRVSLRLAGRGHLHAGQTLLESAVRTWWPITACGIAASRRCRNVIAAFVVLRALRPSLDRSAPDSNDSEDRLDPLRVSCAKIVDDVAYGTGVWFGAWRARDARCLIPRID